MTIFLNASTYKRKLKLHAANVHSQNPENMIGFITRVSGMRLEAKGLSVSLGTICQIDVNNVTSIQAEVIGFNDQLTYLMPIQEIQGIKYGTKVFPLSNFQYAPVGVAMLGRVVDANGKPIDLKGEIEYDDCYALHGACINPLERERITESLDVGIRAINGLLTIGKGQRIGIFAGSGVGKSVLLGMMTRYTGADVVVVGLVGERGREVKEFIEESLMKEGLQRAVVIAAPADTSPLMRANSALLATTVAEYFRDLGLDVLLIVDSITRYAHAQREISLSAGELPATKGFTPSVFAKLSQLVERGGKGKNGVGTITAFYTVLVDGDDLHDPLADHVRSVLDGHIVLSRELADAGHYPAIDIEKSISRIMTQVTTPTHREKAIQFKQLYSSLVRNKEIINMGMYHAGSDKLIDESIKKKDRMQHFLQQSVTEASDFNTALQQLADVVTN